MIASAVALISGMNRLNGKVALVSGGARGMGAAHARAIVAEGGKVVIGDILDAEGKALAEELGAGNAAYIRLDVTDAGAWQAAVDLARERFGALNVLVNNAGIMNGGPLGEYSVEDWQRIIAVNLTAQFLGAKIALPGLIASAPSSVINVSSTAGFQGYGGLHGYTASKFGVRGLSKSLAVELAQYNVRVNSVHPGAVATDMTADLDVAEINPLRRVGTPAELASVIVYLASDESSFATGAEFVVDGGELAGSPGLDSK
jgi:3alpha(or 20beta)-hydroxysteroid dehydrogenase